jgi:hypothetical protein
METLKKFVRFYLQSIDATIRLLGTYLILGLMIAALGIFLNSLNWLFFGSFSTGPLHWWLGMIALPPLLRLGILAGGFSIPPIFGQSASRKPRNDKASKLPNNTDGSAPI